MRTRTGFGSSPVALVAAAAVRNRRAATVRITSQPQNGSVRPKPPGECRSYGTRLLALHLRLGDGAAIASQQHLHRLDRLPLPEAKANLGAVIVGVDVL